MQLGADVDQLEALQAALERAAGTAVSSRTTIDGSLRSAWWRGPNADAFRRAWSGQHRRTLESVEDLLRQQAGELRRQVAEQRRTSDGSSAGRGAVPVTAAAAGAGGGGGDPLAPDHLVGSPDRGAAPEPPAPSVDPDELAADLADAIADGDTDALEALLDQLDGADADAVRDALRELGPDGISEAGRMLLEAGDLDRLEVLGTGLGEALDGMEPTDVEEWVSAMRLGDGDPGFDGTLEVLLASADGLPDDLLPVLLNSESGPMGMGGTLTFGEDQQAALERLTGNPPHEWSAGVYADLLASHPDGLDLVRDALRGDFDADVFDGLPRFGGAHLDGMNSSGLARGLNDFLSDNPGELDGLLRAADATDTVAATDVNRIVEFMDDARVDSSSMITTYTAHAIEQAHVPGDRGDTHANLTNAGEAIARLRNSYAAAKAGVDFDLVGAGIDVAKIGLGEIPIVGTVMTGHGIVAGNTTFPSPPDFAGAVAQNQEDFGFAVDVLTAGHADRGQIVTDLGFELGGNGQVVAPDSGSIDLGELARDHPEYIPLIDNADTLADGMAIAPKGSG